MLNKVLVTLVSLVVYDYLKSTGLLNKIFNVVNSKISDPVNIVS